MVDSPLYAANPDNTNWKQVGTGAQAKKGTHAEITAYNEGKPKSKSNVLMFVQDGAPCEECHPKFRELSRAGTESFIFCITGAGYVVHLDLASGDKIGGMHAPMTNAKANEKHLNQIIMNGTSWTPITFPQSSITTPARSSSMPSRSTFPPTRRCWPAMVDACNHRS